MKDQGVGIPADEQGRIFRRFERGATADQQASGLGLGLYIVKRIVEAHGGKIEVSSTPGLGSEFVMTLGIAPPQGARVGLRTDTDSSVLGKGAPKSGAS